MAPSPNGCSSRRRHPRWTLRVSSVFRQRWLRSRFERRGGFGEAIAKKLEEFLTHAADAAHPGTQFNEQEARSITAVIKEFEAAEAADKPVPLGAKAVVIGRLLKP